MIEKKSLADLEYETTKLTHQVEDLQQQLADNKATMEELNGWLEKSKEESNLRVVNGINDFQDYIVKHKLTSFEVLAILTTATKMHHDAYLDSLTIKK